MADLLMFCSLYIALAIQVLIRRGWIPLRLAPFLRHAFQGCLIGGAVYYSHEQGWFYVQKFWFVMHTLAMFMKVHSFSLMNEKLHETWLKSGKRKKGVLLPKEAIGKLNIFERRHAKDLIYYP